MIRLDYVRVLFLFDRKSVKQNFVLIHTVYIRNSRNKILVRLYVLKVNA